MPLLVGNHVLIYNSSSNYVIITKHLSKWYKLHSLVKTFFYYICCQMKIIELDASTIDHDSGQNDFIDGNILSLETMMV